MTPSRQELRSDVLAIAMAGIKAAGAGTLTARALADGTTLTAGVHLLAAGKAARAMAAAARCARHPASQVA